MKKLKVREIPSIKVKKQQFGITTINTFKLKEIKTYILKED